MARRRGPVFWLVLAGFAGVAWWVWSRGVPNPAPPADDSGAVQRVQADQPHHPVWVRNGTIQLIGTRDLQVAVPRLVGEGDETIAVQVSADTQTIEIRIPSSMTAELNERLNRSQGITRRVAVPFASLKVGQAIAVISQDDMYGRRQVTAARLEYKAVVAPEEVL